MRVSLAIPEHTSYSDSAMPGFYLEVHTLIRQRWKPSDSLDTLRRRNASKDYRTVRYGCA